MHFELIDILNFYMTFLKREIDQIVLPRPTFKLKIKPVLPGYQQEVLGRVIYKCLYSNHQIENKGHGKFFHSFADISFKYLNLIFQF